MLKLYDLSWWISFFLPHPNAVIMLLLGLGKKNKQ